MIVPRFSAAAKTYDRHARPQQTLAEAVISILPEMSPEHILELGAGTGQLTRLLIKRFPKARIEAVDIAEKMVQQSCKQFEFFPYIKWMLGDAQTFRKNTRYPLIVSSAALHWTANLRAACDNIFQHLASGGIFALGIMLQGTLKELRELRAKIAPEKTPDSFILPTCKETETCLRKAGFFLKRRKHSKEKTIYNDAKAFLQAIHEQGVTGWKPRSGWLPLNRSELHRLIADYQKAHSSNRGVYATYETAVFLLANFDKTASF